MAIRYAGSYDVDDDGTGRITHQRADNSRYYWEYDSGTQEDDDADTAQIGSLGPRVKVVEELG